MTMLDCATRPGADATYVYAVVPARARVPDVAAILPGAAIEVLRAGRVAALVTPVSRSRFANPADAAWMAARVLAHRGVVAAAWCNGVCLPFAFGALFANPTLITGWLQQREARLTAALARTADAAEWAVTVTEDAAAHAAWLTTNDPDLAGMAAAAAAASGGTGLLLRRRLDHMCTAAEAARRALLAVRVGTALARHAELVAADPPRRWTVLVGADLLAALQAELAALAVQFEGSGLTITLGGPWPPYGFAREVTGDAC